METMTKTLITVGDRIRVAREKRGLNKNQLATLVGVSRARVTQWEKENPDIRYETLMKLARVLGESPEYIRTGKKGGKVQAQPSDEAIELAHAWDRMQDEDWKQRIYNFVTTYAHFARIREGEKNLSGRTKHKK